jgi:uncharacterized protein YceK
MAAAKAVAALLLLALAGCGTARDLLGPGALETPGPHVYGGVRTDLLLARTPICCSAKAPLLFLPGIPFSAVLDTALLPVTIPIALFRGSP